MTAVLLEMAACSLAAISRRFGFLPLNDECILLPNVGKFVSEKGGGLYSRRHLFSIKLNFRLEQTVQSDKDYSLSVS